MSSPGNSGPLGSSAFRLSLLYALLLAGAFAATAFVVWRNATKAVEAETRQMLELEVAAIAHELKDEGLEAAAAAIRARAERPGAPDYWMTDQSGATLVGDVRELEGPNGWRIVELSGDAPGEAAPEELLILTQTFEGGVRLSVGEDLADRQGAVNQAIAILGKVGALAVGLSLLLGALVTRGTLNQARDIDAVLTKAAEGDFSARTALRGNFLSRDLERVGRGVNRMLDRNGELVSGLRRVSRDIAHDLRTPLFHLSQRLDRARRAAAGDKDREIDAAREKADQIVGVFDAILRLAEIDAGAARSRFEKIDLVEVVEVAADAYRPDVEASGRTLTVQAAGRVFVDGDRQLLMQALGNLIENAMRHTPVGTTISVTASAAETAVLAVSDNGAGIPASMRSEVVKPFMRLDESRSTTGAGLGLSIVAAIARLHEAEFQLADAEPGLTVRLLLKSSVRT